MGKKITAIIGIIISGVYLLNFTLGIFELPDNLPIVGHIDEFAASLLLISSLKYFNIDLTSLVRFRSPAKKKKD